MDEMTQMTESILSNDTAEVERLTAVFLSESFDTPMFSWEWRDNPKREALLIGLTFMHTQPDAVNLQDKTEIFRFMGNTSTFVEYIKYIETSEGITGWVRLFNEMAQEHYLEIDVLRQIFYTYINLLLATSLHFFDMFCDGFLLFFFQFLKLQFQIFWISCQENNQLQALC